LQNLQHNIKKGQQAESNAPAWMNQSFEVHFQDPRLLFVEMLGNPHLANDFDYMLYREFKANSTQCYQHFM
jgi:Plavaka transposase